MGNELWTRRIHAPFILAALGIALTSGFGYGALLVGALAFGIIPGAWYGPTVQAHGHAQLLGWVGLFVMGMGLYFLPKLRGAPLQKTPRAAWAFGLLTTGLALRTVVQPALGFWPSHDAGAWGLRALFALSAVMELAGSVVIASMLIATRRAAKPLALAAPAYPVMPFILIAVTSFGAAFVFNCLGVWHGVLQSRAVLPARYDQLVIQLVLYGVAIPMAIVFSIRNLPLFMRLALPPRHSLRALGLVYAAALLLRVLPFLTASIDDALVTLAPLLRANFILLGLSDALAVVGSVSLNLCLLIWLWQLDLLRRRPPWTILRPPNPRPALDYLRKPTRGRVLRANYPDYGEYGRFELLIYSAYGWLVIAIVLDLLRVVGGSGQAISVTQDAARHALAVGFITLLIFGMAARLAPGFSHKKGLAYPDLVLWTFILGNLAALLRVVPTFFPQSEFARMLWGLSGLLGWFGVLALGVNIAQTLRA